MSWRMHAITFLVHHYLTKICSVNLLQEYTRHRSNKQKSLLISFPSISGRYKEILSRFVFKKSWEQWTLMFSSLRLQNDIHLFSIDNGINDQTQHWARFYYPDLPVVNSIPFFGIWAIWQYQFHINKTSSTIRLTMITGMPASGVSAPILCSTRVSIHAPVPS